MTAPLSLLRAYLRPTTLVLVYLHMVFFALCLAAEGPSTVPWLSAGAALVVMAATYANATAVNDLSDEAVDRINLSGDKERPLVDGRAGRRDVWWLWGVTGAVAVGASCLLAPWVAAVTAFMLALSWVYSMPPVRLSGRGALAQVWLPLEYCALPAVLVAGVVGHASWRYAAVVAAVYLIFVGRLFLKDLRDEPGDRATGKRTYTVRHTPRAAIVQSGLWTVTGTAGLSGLMYVFYDVNPVAVFGFSTLSVGGQLAALVACDQEADRGRRLAYTGVFGRWISMKIYVYVLLMVLAAYGLPAWQTGVVMGLTTVTVLANVASLYATIRGTTAGPLPSPPG